MTPERLEEIREQAEKLREYRLMIVDLLDSRDVLVAALSRMLKLQPGGIWTCSPTCVPANCAYAQARAALRDAGEPE